MDDVNLILKYIFSIIFQLSIMAVVIVPFILLIRLLVKDKITIKFQYALWLILVIRLIFPVTPSSNISIYNYFSRIGANSYVQSFRDIYMNRADARSVNVEAGDGNNNQKIGEDKASVIKFKTINYLTAYCPKIWIIGTVIGFLLISISYIRFLYSIRNCSYVGDKKIHEHLEKCKKLINLNKEVSIVETNLVKTPALLGVLKPKILIPSNLFESYNYDNLKYIFLHELAHIKRKDILINYIITMLSIIHWFNPLIWYAFYKMREDREICCDCMALSCINESEIYNYGLSIITLSEIYSRAPWLPAMAGIINKKSKIKRRITIIKEFKKSTYKLSIAAFAALLIVSSISLTNAKAEPAKTPINKTALEDKIDYPFVNDKTVIGKWECVDFVKEINDFKPGNQDWQGQLYLISMVMLENGKMTQPMTRDIKSDEKTPVSWFTWTKGYIIHHVDKTAMKYTIKNIDGEQYLFFEFKNGDYIDRGQKPYYYVLQKVK